MGILVVLIFMVFNLIVLRFYICILENIVIVVIKVEDLFFCI